MEFEEVKKVITDNFSFGEDTLGYSRERYRKSLDHAFKIIENSLANKAISEEDTDGIFNLLIDLQDCILIGSSKKEDLDIFVAFYEVFSNLNEIIPEVVSKRDLRILDVLISTKKTLNDEFFILGLVLNKISKHLNLDTPSEILSNKYFEEYNVYIKTLDKDKPYL